ncbi:hypothetical protein MCOR14_000740 [Pyricularia oryzae]|uniref:Uncharacterized protein n=1 Tax=Pyricularia oryzae TaxID=318829 RepID=A0A4P7NQN9_PYROR|nr:hypothetical protein MCOR13_000122 [Pyricularia oryzae]KAI6590629.1 hypothetical protein MCOR12_008366 [Pyricularia oryzae]KAI6644896.1 hypothetical protein MCOR14_000740 [Pyricularia oryzae]QBZ64714.1 hypothetical protein PoMZ_06413 [Pyricularia oryzae]
MNTVKSFWAGWGALCLAGGGAYVFAKRSINADRQARWDEQKRKRAMIESLEHSDNIMNLKPSSNESHSAPPRTDTAGSPSQESNSDPAPTRHAPSTEGERVGEKSKYEASQPFRSIKGDRFS